MGKNSSSPKVSVVVSIYNVTPFLRQCLDSVANQTLRDIEVICVDDGSTDGSAEIADEYAAADGRFKVVRQQHAGVGAARNKGLALARGEFIYFLDSDDWVESEALERLSALAEQEKLCQVIFAAKVHFDDLDSAQDNADIARRARLTRYYEVPDCIVDHSMSGIDIAAALIAGESSSVTPGLRLIKRDSLIESGIRFPTGVIHEDEFFAAALYVVSSKVMVVRDKYYHRRFRAGSIMTSQDNTVDHLRGCMTAERLIKEFAKSHFAEGRDEMDFLCGRARAMESAALRYLRPIILGTLPPERRGSALEEIAADDGVAEYVNNVITSRLTVLESEKVRMAKLQKRLEARQRTSPAHAGSDAQTSQTLARPDITPAFAERNIPVAFATDENYLSYVNVAVNSALANSAGSNLDILILHSGISDELIQAFISRYAGFESVSVRFVDMTDALTGSRLADYEQVDRLPVSSCYRLLIPDLLTAYDKLIYLDVDVAVCRDLGELYSTDLGDCYFAAAKDVVHSTNPEYLAWAAGWGFTEWNDYVNTGILVMNLDRFRREPVLDRLSTVVLEAAKWLCDQDALNFVCKGRIAPLDPRWNVQVGDYCLKEQIALTGNEIWIAHFAGGQKPWKLPARRYSHLWWRHVDASDVSWLWARTWGNLLVAPGAGAPKVSVIMPVFNAELFLSEALASILMQKDLPEIEVICIDDGSTDDSAAILAFWGKLDSRLRVFRQKNQGPGVARNAGLDVAKGEYIFFLDADDKLSSGAALRQTYEQARANRLDILLADGSIMSENGKVERREAYLNRNLVPEACVFSPDALGSSLYIIVPMAPWAKLFEREFIEKNNLRFPALKRSEDFPMVQLAVSLAESLGVASLPLFCRRTGVTTSLESTKDKAPLAFVEAERIFRLYLEGRDLLHRFTCAANVAYLQHLAYNLRKVNSFSSFKAISRICAETLHRLGIKGDEIEAESFTSAFELVKGVVAASDNPDVLADMFADILAARHVRHALASGRGGGATERVKIANCEARIAELLRQRGVRDVQIVELEARVAAWKRNAASAQKRVEELLRQRDVRDSRVAELEQRVAAWKRNAENAQTKSDELLRYCGARDSRVAELEQRVAAWKRNAEKARTRNDELLRQRGVRDARVAELERRLEAWKKNCEGKDVRIERLLRRHDDEYNRLQAQGNHIRELERRNALIESDLGRLRAAMAEIAQTVKT